MKYELEAPVVSHERLGDYEYEITLHAPPVAESARAGQFMQVQYDLTYNPFTRRPFSVYRVDKEQGTFSILYLARGVFTQGLRKQHVGDVVSVVGPLGNWYEPDPRPEVTHIMVAGGVGAPPLYLLAQQMLCDESGQCTISVINGARTLNLLCATREFDELGVDTHFTTDDGTRGIRGLVTDALLPMLDAAEGPVHVYTCGPTAMLRAVGDLCVSRGIPCQASVETMMPCGLGVCMGCVVKIKDSASETGYVYQRSCYEGPVFPAERIIWE